MRIGLLSDLHANAPATRAVLSNLTTDGVEQSLCAGDIIGYYPFPNETIDLIHDHDIQSVLGNHDTALLTGDTSSFSINATRAIDWTRRNITDESLTKLKQYQTTLRITIDDVEIFIVHGSPSNPTQEYVYPDTIAARRVDTWFESPPDVLILGHTHVPFKKKVADILIVNPGSVGQPRDGSNNPSFAVLNTETTEIEFKRTPYNIEETAAKTKEYLPIQLAERLFYGE